MNLKNPQTIHVISEVVVMIGVIVWVTSQNRRLSQKLENLLHRCEEQELELQKLTQTVAQLEVIIQQSLVPITTPTKKAAPKVVVVPPPKRPSVEDLDLELQEELRELQESSRLSTIPEEDSDDDEEEAEIE